MGVDLGLGHDRAIVLLSGGVDSATVLWAMAKARDAGLGPELLALVFDYGQTLVREVAIAQAFAQLVRVECRTVKLELGALESPCSLLGTELGDIPTGRHPKTIKAQGTPSTYVPFRNGILLAYAAAVGEVWGADAILSGANGLHSGLYWDDTSEFAEAFQLAIAAGTSPDYSPEVLFPFAGVSKHELVSFGVRCSVPYHTTYSCYLGGEEHCGQCDSCVQRREAFRPHGLSIDGRERGEAVLGQ